MDLLDEIEFKEQQISRLNNLLSRYKEQKIPENKKKKNFVVTPSKFHDFSVKIS